MSSVPKPSSWALSELLKVTSAITTEKDTAKLLGVVLHGACELTNAEAGRILALDATKRFLNVVAFQDERRRANSSQRIPLYRDGAFHNSREVLAHTALTGKLVKLPDIRDTAAFDFSDRLDLEARTGLRTRSLLVVPLSQPGQYSVGVMELVNYREPNSGVYQPFPDEFDELAQMFASQAAVAVYNNQLEQENQRLITVLDETNRALAEENTQLKRRLSRLHSDHGDLLGESPAMLEVYELIDKVAQTTATVLITGETGTGKEVVAHAIHDKSSRAGGPFVAQNCAALPEQLLESEFFGHTKGAFTGAVAEKKGLFEAASGGTMFLDEIGDLPLMLQAKLLRVLQEGEIRPLGSVTTRSVDVRILAATHQDLKRRVASGEFREDLYYRLSVFPIELPPVRMRGDDLLLMADHFLNELCLDYGRVVEGFTPKAMKSLLSYGYPGNVRELRNLIERAILLVEPGQLIDIEHFPQELSEANRTGPHEPHNLRDAVAQYEASLIERALHRHHGNQTHTARALNVSRRALIEKMKRYALTSVTAE